MSVKKFIETGIIEGYVLGLCTPDELKQVKAMKAKHPTVVAEIKAVREALLAYALKHGVKPPEQLKEKILSEIKSSGQKPAARKPTNEEGKEIKIKEEVKQEIKEVKAPETKSFTEKTPEVKAQEVKIPEVSTDTAKAAELKTKQIKPSEVKTLEGKAPEKSREEKTPERKTIQEKIPETKKEESKPQQAQIRAARKVDGKGFETVKSFLIVAALALLLASAYFNYFLYQRLQEVKNKSADLKTEKELLAQRLQSETSFKEQQLAEKQAAIEQRTAAVENLNKDRAALLSSFKVATLTSEGAAVISKKELYPGALATVYWNPTSKEVFFKIENLPAPDSTRHYQLWAMADGKPADAGIFEAGGNISGLQRAKDVKSAQMFTVTLEKRGGSHKPTLEAMYLAGKVP